MTEIPLQVFRVSLSNLLLSLTSLRMFSGFGYFVVTPDTFRLHAEDQLATTWNTAWTHLHPMYIPAAFSQPQKAPMRSISCQVDGVEEKKPAIGQNESGDLTEVGLPNSNAIQVCRSKAINSVSAIL